MKHGLLIDMDGVIYGGDELIQGADEFISELIKKDIPFMFMTNNSQRTRLEVVRKLKKLGINVTEKHVYTSAMATGKFLADQSPNKTAYVLGEGGLLTSLHENGLTLVEHRTGFYCFRRGKKFYTRNGSKSGRYDPWEEQSLLRPTGILLQGNPVGTTWVLPQQQR